MALPGQRLYNEVRQRSFTHVTALLTFTKSMFRCLADVIFGMHSKGVQLNFAPGKYHYP